MYVFAPEADIFVLPPLQIADEAAVTVRVGIALIVNVTVWLFLQPFASVPFTVYVVVVVGVAVTGVPFALLSVPEGVQVYVFAPLAEIVVFVPLHIADDVGVRVNVGSEFTVTSTV